MPKKVAKEDRLEVFKRFVINHRMDAQLEDYLKRHKRGFSELVRELLQAELDKDTHA